LSRHFYERKIVPFYECLAVYVSRRIEEGAFRKMDPILIARSFTGMVCHHAFVLSIHRCDVLKAGRDEVVAGMVELFLQGVRTNA
jgi:hypothetical protein